MIWVVCYDVVDDKRRRKVMETLEGYGRRAQYSVFECDLDLTKVLRLSNQLNYLINQEEDDVRFYPLNEGDVKRIMILGKGQLNRNDPAYLI